MPEQTRVQQQHMLAQQAFIWIRLFMNSTLTDLHPDCKRLFQRWPSAGMFLPFRILRRRRVHNLHSLWIQLYAHYPDPLEW